MDTTELIGGLAAVITTFCWLPQAIHIFRTKETAGISAITYAAYSFGIFCWLVYGILLQSLPLILGNIISLALTLAILALKLVHMPRKAKKTDEHFP